MAMQYYFCREAMGYANFGLQGNSRGTQGSGLQDTFEQFAGEFLLL
jgi:hypothetical protein